MVFPVEKIAKDQQNIYVGAVHPFLLRVIKTLLKKIFQKNQRREDMLMDMVKLKAANKM